MPERHSFILVHLVERYPEGYRFARSRSRWPLHITLVPWFFVATPDQPKLTKTLAAYAASAAPFEATVGGEAMFGPAKDVPVNVVDGGCLTRLHSDLLGVVGEFTDATARPPHTGEGYRPHITHHVREGVLHRRFAGDIIRVGDITLATLVREDGRELCELSQNYTLGEGNEAAA